MVTSFFKWLFLPLFAGVFLSATWANSHPFHVSVTEINHNSTDKTLEISCKVFTDDFETILAKLYKTKIDLINPTVKEKMDSLVKSYVLSHLFIRVNGKAVLMNYIGFENEKEAIYSYVEIENVQALSKLEITNQLMYDLFTDQVNIMHVIEGGNRRSTKLTYPDTDAVFTY